MTTRFAFGFGEGDIYRRRMEGQGEMFRQVAKEREELPEEDRQRLDYASDYYGFRGAGRRAGNTEAEGGARGRRGGGRTRRGTR